MKPQTINSGTLKAKAKAIAIASMLIAIASPISASNAQSITDRSCAAHVIGQHVGTQVNIRNGAAIDFDVVGTVSVGNLVIVVNDDQHPGAQVMPLSRRDDHGQIWYMTARYRASEYRGWMRSDFLLLKCPDKA